MGITEHCGASLRVLGTHKESDHFKFDGYLFEMQFKRSRADAIALNTPHTKEKSDKIIPRTFSTMGTLPVSGGENST